MNYKEENMINRKKIYFCLIFCLFFTIFCGILIIKPNIFNNKHDLITEYSKELNQVTNLLVYDSSNISKNTYKKQLNRSIVNLDLLDKKISYINTNNLDDSFKLDQLLICIENIRTLANYYLNILESEAEFTEYNLSEAKILKDACNISFNKLHSYNINTTFSDKNILYFDNIEKLLISSKSKDNNSIKDTKENNLKSLTSEDLSSLPKILEFLLHPNGINKIVNLFN